MVTWSPATDESRSGMAHAGADTRARNSRNSNATGKLPDGNPTTEFRSTRCHRPVPILVARHGRLKYLYTWFSLFFLFVFILPILFVSVASEFVRPDIHMGIWRRQPSASLPTDTHVSRAPVSMSSNFGVSIHSQYFYFIPFAGHWVDNDAEDHAVPNNGKLDVGKGPFVFGVKFPTQPLQMLGRKCSKHLTSCRGNSMSTRRRLGLNKGFANSWNSPRFSFQSNWSGD